MKTRFKIYIISLLLCVPMKICGAYDVIQENYEGNNNWLFKSSTSQIINGDGENNTRFIEPIKNSGNQYRLGFYTAESEFSGTVTVDFRAKAVDNATYFQFDTRQNSSYEKTFSMQLKDSGIIKKWRYYRIVIDFAEQRARVYSSESGFDSLGAVSEGVYGTSFINTSGFNMFRFINCRLDDVAVYAGGTAPYIKSAELKQYGARLKTAYLYADDENDDEGRTQVVWQRSDNGTDFSQIYGERGTEYLLTPFDQNKFIRAVITPCSTFYPTQGEPYCTDAVLINNVNDYVLKNSGGEEVCEISKGVYSLEASLKSNKSFSAVLAVYSPNGALHKIYRQKGEKILIDNIDLRDIEPGSRHRVFFFETSELLKPVFDSDSVKNTLYKAALEDLNLSEKEKAMYNDADYEGALKESRGRFFGNLPGSAHLFSEISGSMAAADELFEKNNITLTNDSAKNITIHMGESGAYNWMNEDLTYIKYGLRLDWTQNLIYAFRQTGDEKYLKKWVEIWRDFDENFYPQYKIYTEEVQTHIGGINLAMLKVGQLNVGMRAINRLTGLTAADIDRFLSDADYAKMMHAQSRDCSAISVDSSTPNQFLFGYTALLTAAECFDSLKIRNRLDTYETEMETFIGENYNADGGETEMSLHYNYDFFSYYEKIIEIYADKDNAPVWLSRFKDIAENKLKLLACVITPTKHSPSLAHDYITENAVEKVGESMKMIKKTDKTTETVLNKLTGKSAEAPPFASIAFPYSGYYVMRSGWEANSDYLFFMGARFGRGHVEMNKLSVDYTAFGEDLLQSSPSSYSSDKACLPYDRFFESGFGNNTVTVDGYSQRRLIGAYSDFSTPESSLWYTSDIIDYAQSVYSGGYNTYQGMWDERKKAVVDDVSHARHVISDKKNRVAVVCDSLLSASSHTYTQNWNFAKKFNNKNMITLGSNAVKTNGEAKGTGIEIYGFSPSELKTGVMCGEKTGEIYKGWYLDSYGTNYTPCVHTETEFSGSGKQQIATLIVPKENAETRIKEIEEICGGSGFFASLTDGDKIICLLNCDNASFNGISFSGDMLYITKNEAGKISGIAVGAESLIIGTQRMAADCSNFVFEAEDKLVWTEITNPAGFSWSGDDGALKPIYTKGW